MRPVSDRFLTTIRGSHSAFSRVRVCTTFQEGTDPDGTEVAVHAGQVTADAQANVRGRLTLQVKETFPTQASDLLIPYGNELFVERGLRYGDGDSEAVSLGYYRIHEVEQVDDEIVEITAMDRMAGIVEAKLEAPVQFEAGASIQTVFNTLVHEVYPTATIEFDFNAAGTFLASDHVADQDRYQLLADIAKSRGKVMFWDYAGILQVQDPPDPSQPVWTVNSGRDGVLVSLHRSISRDGVYNAVVVTGEQPSSDVPPVRAIARDSNPNSPTYYYGPFGKVVKHLSSTFVTSPEQAVAAAVNLLKRAIGLPYSVDLTFAPNWALEALDPVLVIYPNARKEEVHVLEKISVGLSVADVMTASTREQSDLSIEVVT